MLSKHLGDLLAALIQLACAPLKKPSAERRASEFMMTTEKYERLSSEQALFRQLLAKLMDRVYQPLLVKCLLILQSSGTSEKNIANCTKSPHWLRSEVGNILSERLMMENGVMNIVRGVIGATPSPDKDDDDDAKRKIEIIAGVLSSVPAKENIEVYFSKVCPQIRAMLSATGDTESKEFLKVACACIKAVSERSLIQFRRHLLEPLLAPLFNLCAEEFVEERASEEELQKCIDGVHQVFVIYAEPSGIFMSHLQPVVPVLLQLHCFLHFSMLHLKNVVQDILKRFLRIVSASESNDAIRYFAFSGYELGVSANKQKDPWQFKLMRSNIAIKLGSGGGIAAVRSEEIEQNFSVSDDEKAIAIVDLLDERQSLEFFMSLLHDLSSMMASKSLMQDAAIDVMGNRKGEKRDLQFELSSISDELDATMVRLRRNLMVIRLLGLLSEDEKLQLKLVKESDRFLEFVGLTLERGAISCQEHPSGNDLHRAVLIHIFSYLHILI